MQDKKKKEKKHKGGSWLEFAESPSVAHLGNTVFIFQKFPSIFEEQHLFILQTLGM